MQSATFSVKNNSDLQMYVLYTPVEQLSNKQLEEKLCLSNEDMRFQYTQNNPKKTDKD